MPQVFHGNVEKLLNTTGLVNFMMGTTGTKNGRQKL